MSTVNFDLLDVFPIRSRDHTAQELALDKFGISPLREINIYADEVSIIKEIINEHGGGEARSTYEDALRNSKTYKKWQKEMPFLKDLPNIKKYRRNHHDNLSLVNDEIQSCGGLLAINQILFRGGKFSAQNIELINEPISTSASPSVAYWHAKEVKGDVAILQIAEDQKIKAFAYKTTGNQYLKHEFEVILQNHIKLEYESNFTHNGMNVYKYNVFLK